MAKARNEGPEAKFDADVWMLVSELWQILRYQAPGSHRAKLKAAERLQEFIDQRERTATAWESVKQNGS